MSCAGCPKNVITDAIHSFHGKEAVMRTLPNLSFTQLQFAAFSGTTSHLDAGDD